MHLTAQSFFYYVMTIKYFFLYLLKVTTIQGTSDFRWLVHRLPCKKPSQRTSAKPLPVFQPLVFTFTSAAKDKSNNGDINHIIMPYQPGNEAMKPVWL